MLQAHFINVGDGDAILLEERQGERVFRLLVDAGLPEVERAADSLRLSCRDYLRRLGVTHLDAAVITHLHLDHFGGLRQLLPEISIDRVYAAFFPPAGARIVPEPDAQKTVRGLIACLNRWAEDSELLRARGCRLISVDGSCTLRWTDRLTASLLGPDPAILRTQRRIWSDMLAGRKVPEEMRYWASKIRNPASLRLCLHYGGRSLLLAGDCYGAVWEEEPWGPCDILKVPHHGDRKALTPVLAEKLRPAHAVISCAKDYIPRKDRPSYDTVQLLRQQGARVWFTDSFADGGQEAKYWNSVDFTIWEDGAILAPDGRCSGGR